MTVFIIENLGTIIVSAALLGIVAAATAKIVRDKRKGGCAACGNGCNNCRRTQK